MTGIPVKWLTALRQMAFGDLLEAALSNVGITQERVTAWLGRPCGCQRRKEKMNQLGAWIRQRLAGRLADPAKELEKIMDDGED